MNREYTILIAEDNSVNRRILTRILQDTYDVLEAPNGVAALNQLETRREAITAVILDLEMPDMNGYEVMARIRENPRLTNLPVLVVTSDPTRETEERCLKLGAWDFVSKPYMPAILLLRLNNIISRSQVQLMQQIRLLAERDNLTGVYNRAYFMQRTRQLLQKHPDETFVLLRLDIDRFRTFNSFFGSAAGDALLRQIGQGLAITRQHFPYCTYGHMQADVFCICEPYRPDKLQEQLTEMPRNLAVLCENYYLKVSIGVYVITDPAMDVEELYSRATMAADKCKENSLLPYAFYDTSLSENAAHEQLIMNSMHAALAEEQFLVYLQPKYNLKDNTPYGAEALVRWNTPERGMIPPGEFIPLFERNGFITKLDLYMWEHVCRLLRGWMDRGLAPTPISVNVSRVSLHNPHVVELIEGLVKQYQIPPSLLNLEVTESAYMAAPERMKSVLARLQSLGFLIMMDDFGSGYSSLNTLKEINVDILKIDMKFLPSDHSNGKSEKILTSIIHMAGWLGMPVVVEGVETRDQRDFLESIGCGYVQGYYYARPMPVADYEQTVLLSQGQCPAPPSKPDLCDLDVIWRADLQTGALLKSILVPVALYEYSNHRFELLRANHPYLVLFEPDIGTNPHEDALDREDLLRLETAFAQAVQEKGSATCECLYLLPCGVSRWFRVELQYLKTVNSTHVVCAAFTDVTHTHQTEARLNRVRAILETPGAPFAKLLAVGGTPETLEELRGLFADRYELLFAHDGRTGLSLLERHAAEIALVLLQTNLPDLAPETFLARKNALEAAVSIPVIALSEDLSAAAQKSILQAGAFDCVALPFEPEVLRCRVRNVLDYTARLRAVVTEHREELAQLPGSGLHFCLKEAYTPAELHMLLTFMAPLFDMVRLVDPYETAILTVTEAGTVERAPYCCFRAWEKNTRCESCISMCAARDNCRTAKFEQIDDRTFYVISTPLRILCQNAQTMPAVLEIVSHLSADLPPVANSGLASAEQLRNAPAQSYRDPLTGVFNRRFFEEEHYLYHGQSTVARRVAFVLLRVRAGQSAGDSATPDDVLLRAVADALSVQLRPCDSMIRYSADCLLIVLTGISRTQAERTVHRLRGIVRAAVRTARPALSAGIAFGCACTDRYASADRTALSERAYDSLCTEESALSPL